MSYRVGERGSISRGILKLIFLHCVRLTGKMLCEDVAVLGMSGLWVELATLQISEFHVAYHLTVNTALRCLDNLVLLVVPYCLAGDEAVNFHCLVYELSMAFSLT